MDLACCRRRRDLNNTHSKKCHGIVNNPKTAGESDMNRAAAAGLCVVGGVILVFAITAVVLACLTNRCGYNRRVRISDRVVLDPAPWSCDLLAGSRAATVVQRIPRIIYRSWRDANLPSAFRRAWDHTQTHNPAYRQVLYTDADVAVFMRTVASPRVRRCFEAINPKYGAARADVFRYAVLFAYGGVWLDIKSSADDLSRIVGIDDGYLLAKWNIRTGQRADFCAQGLEYACLAGEYQQWWIACVPRHPFLRRVLDAVAAAVEGYDPARFPPGKESVLRLTGPTIYTITIDRTIADGCRDFRLVRPQGFINRSTVHYSALLWAIVHFAATTLGLKSRRHYSQQTEPIVIG